MWFRRTKPLATIESEIKLVRKWYSLVTTIWFMENRGDTVFPQMIFDSFLNLPFNYLSHLSLEYLGHGKTQRGIKKSENIIYYLFRFWFFQHPFLLHQQREELSNSQTGRGTFWPSTTEFLSREKSHYRLQNTFIYVS